MRVAIIGAGISGLGAAYLLSRTHEVLVFEQATRAGGHTRTVRSDGLSLDMGFLVHNERNYPLLTRLFRELGVATQDSEMSFSVSCTCGLEYSSSHPFAQSRRLGDPRHLFLLGEIARWLRTAARSLGEPGSEDWTLQRFLDEHRFSHRFRRHFLVPMTAALWSTAPGRALEYPAAAAIRFFENHGMLGFRRFGWRYVTGGSDSYVRAIADRLGSRLALGRGVGSIRRDSSGVDLTAVDGSHHRFDAVVIATHADQALRLLDDASPRAADDPKFQSDLAQALGIYWKDTIDIPIIQWLHRIPYNNTYWTNWPSAKNLAMGTNGAFWAHTGMLVITSLKPTGAK